MFDDLVSLLYPAYCYRCGDRLHKKQKYFCYGCEDLLPLHSNDNPLSGIFHERMFNKLELSQAFSYFNYQKSGPIQELIHDFKYAGIKQIGAYYGHKLALDISQTILYKPDLIIPVPLHKKKLRSRGYNQAQIIGEALGQTLQVPILLYGVHKRKDTLTQTKLSR
ncbi:MAG TPA: hypothetical protein VL947_08215, partial [Cytophagales bacterium]|nr:hypothetical protein [Cytophagales bacterium]